LKILYYDARSEKHQIVQYVTVLNTIGNYNTMISIIILYYNIMGPPSCMRPVVDRNVVMRRIPVV